MTATETATAEGITGTPTDLAPATVKQWLDENQCVLVDVREDAERKEEHIARSVSMPLSRFNAKALREAHPDAKFVFHCKGGKRSAKACGKFSEQFNEPTQHLAGGIDAWIAAGQPTVKPAGGPPIPIMRQVLLTAGLLVALGTLLAATVSPWFLIIPGFVGCGLTFSGATGSCGMAMMLGKMHWNQ